MKIDSLTKPNTSTIFLFVVFAIIVYFANVQAWGFCKECGIPKPFFYDIIFPIGFWLMGAMLTFPVGILFGSIPGPLFMITQIAYVYVLSIILIQIRKKYLFKKTYKVLLTTVGLLFLFTLWDTGLFQPHPNDTLIVTSEPPGITFYVGYLLIPMTIIILVYGTLLAGAYFYLLEKIRPTKHTP